MNGTTCALTDDMGTRNHRVGEANPVLPRSPTIGPSRADHPPGPPVDVPSDPSPDVALEVPEWKRVAAYVERVDDAGTADASEDGATETRNASDDTEAPGDVGFSGHIGAPGLPRGVSGAHPNGAVPLSRPGPATGIRGSGALAPTDAPGGSGVNAVTRAEAQEIIDQAMAQSVSASHSDDYVRLNVTAEVLRHATPEQKAHMLRQLMDGFTSRADERAMARILRSIETPNDMQTVLRRAGGADRVWDELASQRGAVGEHFASRGASGQQVLLEIADNLSVESSVSDDFVANHVSPAVLQHATEQQKARMLRQLMDGYTGGRDERAMRRVLETIQNPDHIMTVLAGAGGTEAVFDELEDEGARWIATLQSRSGPEGHRAIARMAASFDVRSSDSDNFVRDYVDDRVLQHATPEQKARMLQNLMHGPTGARDERAMRRVLESIASPAELQTVLARAGSADAVWRELDGQQDAYIGHLKTQGAAGHQQVAAWASTLSVSPTARRFALQHVDGAVLAQATEAQKAAVVRRLRHGNPGNRARLAIRRVLMSARNVAELERIAGAAGGLSRILDLDNPSAAFQRNVARLLKDPQFAALSSAGQTAALAQTRNYPDARSVANMNRLIDKGWFRAMSVADQQRSLKMVAFLSQHDQGHRTIIDHTLDRFLAPGATYQFDWTETRSNTFGSALGTQFHFNRDYLDANNRRVRTADSDEMHLVGHTVAHEVNHLVNADTVSQTEDYFMAEYRAYYVGFRAEHGRVPTRAEMLRRARHLLTATSGAYDSIRRALADPTEGPKIVAFMKRLLGRNDVTQANAATLPARNARRPAPPPTGDIDN